MPVFVQLMLCGMLGISFGMALERSRAIGKEWLWKLIFFLMLTCVLTPVVLAELGIMARE